MSTTNSTIETTISSVATKGMGGGAATSVVGTLANNEVIAGIGIAVTILGFIVNLIFQIRRDKREQELHRTRLQTLEKSND